jgi:hypothetical protein
LPFIQRTQPRAFNGGDVHKNVLAAAPSRLDESIALRRIEPLHSTFRHFPKLQEFLGSNQGILIVARRIGKAKKLRHFCRGSKSARVICCYSSVVETVLNVVFKFVPSTCTVAMIATAIPAAMRPYSMAAAPEGLLSGGATDEQEKAAGGGAFDHLEIRFFKFPPPRRRPAVSIRSVRDTTPVASCCQSVNSSAAAAAMIAAGIWFYPTAETTIYVCRGLTETGKRAKTNIFRRLASAL